MATDQLDSLTPEDLPRCFGRYEFQSILGAGGMARVYGAEFHGPAGFRKQVAVKVIASDKIKKSDEVAAEAFIREARLGGLLKHPNIVDVYELGEIGGQLFISMEWVQGMTLHSLIGQGYWPPASVVLEIAAGIAGGLASAHALRSDGLKAGLVHRDLKPSNVLLSWNGAVKVMDFGIATTRYGELSDGSTDSSDGLGTPSYMSPEQLYAEALDGRSDQFALGLLMTELASGCFLPRNALYERLKAGGSRTDPVVSDEILAEVDASVAGLRPIVERCLQPFPEGRYASTDVLLADLEELRECIGLRPRLRTWLESVVVEHPNAAEAAAQGYRAEEDTKQLADNDASTLILESSTELRTNLGPPLDQSVGRAAEVQSLRTHFDEGSRLVTIKGTGGAGKTRLARLYARSQVSVLDGGVWFMDLTETRSSKGLVHATATVLGISLGGGEVEDLVREFTAAVAERGPMLLVFDNFEQVVQHAATTVGSWLRMMPEVRFLVTSREPLRLSGERVFTLQPLTESDGVALFELRARSAGAHWEDTAENRAATLEIVQRLDGLPLAIELAAARTRVLAPDRLLERLSQRFKLLSSGRRGAADRQSSLRGLIDWSWDLLEPWEQSALAQLSVFRDGFFMEAAEAVLDLSEWPEAPWSLDVVGSLLDKSLLYSRVVDGQPRFGMYSSIQEYAVGKLGSETESTGLRHAEYYGSLRRTATGSPLLLVELENLVVGVAAGLAGGMPEVAADCALMSSGLFQLRGPYTAGITLLEQCLGQSVSLETQEILYRRLGWMQRLSGDVAGAVDRSRMALSYARQIGNPQLEGVNLGNLGSIFREQGRYSEALEHIEQALSLHREVGDRMNEAIDLGKLGQIHQDQGRPDVALDYLMQSVALSREMGNAHSASIDLANIALLHRSQGRLKQALEYFREALSAARELGNRRSEGVTLGNLGDLMVSMGDVESAAGYLADAIVINDETLPMAAGAFRGSLAVILAEQGEMDEALAVLLKGEPQLRGVHKVEYGKFLCKKARVNHLAGDEETAQVALQAAKMLADEVKAGPESEFRQTIQSAEAVILGRDV